MFWRGVFGELGGLGCSGSAMFGGLRVRVVGVGYLGVQGWGWFNRT